MKKEIPKTKRCRKCDKRKAAKHFHKNRSMKDGLAYYCIPCSKVYYNKAYKDDPEHFKQKAAEWKEKNYDRWYELNRQYQYAWRERNREKYNSYLKEYQRRKAQEKK